MHMYIYIYIYTHTHTHTHIFMQSITLASLVGDGAASIVHLSVKYLSVYIYTYIYIYMYIVYVQNYNYIVYRHTHQQRVPKSNTALASLVGDGAASSVRSCR